MKPLLSIGCGLLLVTTGCATAQEDTNQVEQTNPVDQTNSPVGFISPRAETVLHSACEFLAHTHAFTLQGEFTREEVGDSGEKIQFSRTVKMDVKRPDGLRLEISSPYVARGFWYDGKSLTIFDRKHNFFSTNAMPANLDEAVDSAHDLGIDLPLIDLAMSDPYKNATDKVVTGRYFGTAPVMGILCHHLAFTQDNVDWQIWVEDGAQPLIRKLVITYKNEPGSPEFSALITKWNMSDRIADSDFIFERPMGASQINVFAEEPGDTGTTSSNGSKKKE